MAHVASARNECEVISQCARPYTTLLHHRPTAHKTRSGTPPPRCISCFFRLIALACGTDPLRDGTHRKSRAIVIMTGRRTWLESNIVLADEARREPRSHVEVRNMRLTSIGARPPSSPRKAIKRPHPRPRSWRKGRANCCFELVWWTAFVASRRGRERPMMRFTTQSPKFARV